MRTLVAGMVLAVLLSFSNQVSCKNACSKDWLRYMVVNACGMDKRHLDRRKPALAPSLKEILNEVDQELDNYQNKEDDFSDFYEKPRPPTPSEGVTKPPWKLIPFHAKDKESTKSEEDKRPFFRRLFEHPLQLFAETWLGLVGSEPKKMPRRRAIQNMISRCCSEDCTEEAFEGVCD